MPRLESEELVAEIQVTNPKGRSPLIKLLASGFGAGYLFPFPGTWGSLPPVFLAWFLLAPHPIWYLSLLPFLLLVGASVAARAERIWVHDDRRIVIDEFIGMLVTLFLVPRTFGYYLAGFLLFRFLDIFKPFPARSAEKLPAGWGVMGDDIIAGIYANLLLQLYSLWAGR